MTIWIIPELDRKGRAVCHFWLQGGIHNENDSLKFLATRHNFSQNATLANAQRYPRYNNIQDLLIPSRLNDHTNCKRCFNVDIMMLYISVRDHARKLKFCSYIHLPSINKVFQYRYA